MVTESMGMDDIRKHVITFMQPDMSIEGRLKSRIDAIAWDYDAMTGLLSNPHELSLNISNAIPTHITKNPPRKELEKGVESYKAQVRVMYQNRLAIVNRKLASSREGTKRFAELAEKKTVFEDFLGDLDDLITLEFGHRSGSYATYLMNVPFLFSKYQRLFLPSLFNSGRYASGERHAKYVSNFPFSIVEEKDGELKFTGERPSLEHMLSAKGMAIDFETHNWQRVRVRQELSSHSIDDLKQRLDNLIDAYDVKFDKRRYSWMRKRHYLSEIESILEENKDERLTAASLITLQNGEDYLVTTLDCGKDEIDVQIPGTDRTTRVKIIKVGDQNDLIEEVNRLTVDIINPFYVYGHNHLKFDYGKAEELTNNFRIGVNRRPALHIAQTPEGFIVQRITPGRVDLDAAVFSQNYMKNRNNRLDTVFTNVTGIPTKKTIGTHDELAVQTARAEKGDKEAAYQILYYAAQDSMKSKVLSDNIIRGNMLLAYAESSLPARINTTAKKTIAEDYWVKRYWNMKKSYPSDIQNMPLPGTNKTYYEFSPVWFMHQLMKKKGMKLSSQKGLMDGIMVDLFPFSKVYSSLLQEDSNVKAVYDYVESISDPKEKSRILRALEVLSEYPLFRTIDPGMFNRKFSAEFDLGFDRDHLDDFQTAIDETIDDLVSYLSNTDIINVHDETFILSADTPVDVLDFIESNWLGVVHGRGRFFSGTPRRFACLMDGEFMMYGIADYQSNKGMRSQFEKDFYRDFLHIVLEQGKIPAMEYLADQCRALASGDITEPDLSYRWEARRDHNQYSAKYRSKKKSIMQDLNSKEGDLVMHQLSQHDLQQKLFGFSQDYQERKSQHMLSDLPLFSGLGMSGVAPELKDGTISCLINWLNDCSNKEGAELFRNLYFPRDTCLL
ncbi:hypothetical protein H6503_00045 [Candidatus Woesearchaeota archaeon]|nr:hypothetical protein [Candidatus Woesearchaeota archaeon]